MKTLNVIACTECRRKFSSTMALNIHLNKAHSVDYKIHLNEKGRAYARKTKRIKVSKATIDNYL